METAVRSQQQAAIEQQRFITKVYGWMSFALAITGAVSFLTAGSPYLLNFIFGSRFVFFGLIIGELALVFAISALINKLTPVTAMFMFLLYSVVNGLTLSVIFLVYTSASIATTFFITAGTFGVMSAYGYFTKTDLTKIGNILFMALVGLVIASIVNIFLKSPMLYWIVTFAGIIIFVGLTAYDTQKIKNIGAGMTEGSDEEKKGAIMGALTLYLDFINLFLMLLRLFGRRR